MRVFHGKSVSARWTRVVLALRNAGGLTGRRSAEKVDGGRILVLEVTSENDCAGCACLVAPQLLLLVTVMVLMEVWCFWERSAGNGTRRVRRGAQGSVRVRVVVSGVRTCHVIHLCDAGWCCERVVLLGGVCNWKEGKQHLVAEGLFLYCEEREGREEKRVHAMQCSLNNGTMLFL